MRYYVAILMLIHGSVHFMGYAGSFGFSDLSQIKKNIPKAIGPVWMLTAFLFATAAGLLVFEKNAWWFFSLISIVISQILILSIWYYAKFGTLINILIAGILLLTKVKLQLF